MYFSSSDVANTFLVRSFRQSVPVTAMRLQRMLFFAHSDHLDRAGTPLVHERFIAWPYGPVLPSIQQKFGAFVSNAITRFATDAASDSYVVDEQKRENIRRSIDLVWTAALPLTSAELSRIARDTGSAGTNAHESGHPLDDADIARDRPHLALYRAG